MSAKMLNVLAKIFYGILLKIIWIITTGKIH